MMKVGFYEADITPPLYLNMGGYPYERLAESVLENLYAKAAVFEQNGIKTAILSVDMCSLRKSEYDDIMDRIEKYTDLKRENILACANHTHKGYPYFINTQNKTIEALREIFVCRAADSVILANQKLSEAKVIYGEEFDDTVAKNRDYLMKDGKVITNPGRLNPDVVKSAGNIDPKLPVLYFEDASGKPKGAVISYSCHQDCVGLEKAYSGDYSSLIAKELKKEFGHDFVCIFLLGCCGDINHVDVFRPFIDKQYREISEKLSPKVISAIKNGEVFENPELSCISEKVSAYKNKVTDDELKEHIKAYCEIDMLWWIRALVNYHLAEKEEAEEITVQCMRIGDCLIYALPGEVFVDFQLDIRKNSPSDKNMFSSLSNGSSGYIPTPETFDNIYSYEAVPINFVPDTGVKISEKAVQIAKKLF